MHAIELRVGDFKCQSLIGKVQQVLLVGEDDNRAKEVCQSLIGKVQQTYFQLLSSL